MWLLKRAEPVVVALIIVSLATIVLFLVRQRLGGEPHLVFFYLLPMAFVAVLYGGASAMICVAAATVCGAFFLYDPVYTFYFSDPADLGELVCFAGLALIGAKCTADLMRPVSDPARPSRAQMQNRPLNKSDAR